MDPTALEISMVIASAMNCALVDEVHVSRKQYLDGSIPTGFQRTAIISLGGHVPWVGQDREIEIRQISLEEDACREMSDVGHDIVMRTDRLSIPLVEVVTEPNARNPQEAGEMAEILGWVMRSTDLVRRGSGATRQDVNVSVEGGRRVEIKGVPKIELIPTVTAGEAVRQHNLLNINKELVDRGLDPEKMDADEFTTMRQEDVTDIFENREIDLFSPWFEGKVTKRDDIDIKAVLIPGFKDIFSHPTHGDQTFADEVGGRLRVIACLDRMPNLLTSDDEPMRGVEEADLKAVIERMDAKEKDSVVLVWGPKNDTLTGVKEVYIRSKEAFFGIPHETRQVLNPHMTTFERILPGPDRMYPDTDRPPITVTEQIRENVIAQIPRSYWEEEEVMVRSGVQLKVAHRLVVSKWIETYREAVKAGAPARFSTFFLMEDLKAVDRSGVDIDKIPHKHIVKLLSMVGEGKITRKAAPVILSWMAESGVDASKAVEELNMSAMPENEAVKVISDVLSKNKKLRSLFDQGKKDPLMGKIMGALGNRFEGARVHEIILGQA
jgi:glutamyl-tRNA(Gln) amidotransferase subunit E